MVSVATALAIAGCTDHGSYRVSWVFVGDEPAGVGCSQHGWNPSA